MAWEHVALSKDAAIEEFHRCTGRQDGARVLPALWEALAVLRDLLYVRLHDDVERIFGQDSMYMPVSEIKSRTLTKAEIERFQVAEAVVAVRDGGYFAAVDWCGPWLLRLGAGQASDGQHEARLQHYLGLASDARRLALSDVLSHVFPESRKAPLVLLRLYPLAVRLATARAFDDDSRAALLRQEQLAELPAIADCGVCHGKLLDHRTPCITCGNPLWRSEWLMRA